MGGIGLAGVSHVHRPACVPDGEGECLVGHREHRAVSRQEPGGLVGVLGPPLHQAVGVTGRETGAGRCQGDDRGAQPVEWCAVRRERVREPLPDGAVGAGCDHLASVASEPDGVDSPVVARQGVADRLARVRVPQAHRAISATCRQVPTVLREMHPVDRPQVSGERGAERLRVASAARGGGVPELHRPVCAAGRQAAPVRGESQAVDSAAAVDDRQAVLVAQAQGRRGRRLPFRAFPVHDRVLVRPFGRDRREEGGTSAP